MNAHTVVRTAGLAALAAASVTAGCQWNGADGGMSSARGRVPAGLSAAAIHRIASTPLRVAPAVDSIGQKGSLLTSGPYRIFTTIHNPLQQRLIMRVLAYAHRRFIGLLPAANDQRSLRGYIFAHREQWTAYTQAEMRTVAPYALKPTVLGYDRKGVFALYRTSVAEMLSVAAHEAWLQFSCVSLKNHLPAWMDEGLAAQFEAVCWRHGKPEFISTLNYPRWLALRSACRRQDLIPLHIFTRMDAGAAVAVGPRMTEIYYAQLWSFTLFIIQRDGWSTVRKALQSAADGQLTPSLLKAGLRPADLARETTQWNMVAGPIFLKRFFTRHPRLFFKQYRTFAGRLASQWPPVKPTPVP